jgi:hypothetical protein
VKVTLAHVHTELETVPAAALLGGTALYYAAHVGFRLRSFGTVNGARVLAALAALALIPLATAVDAVVALGLAAALSSALIAYETVRFRDFRQQIRHESAA